ncbi:MAG: GNAT family N-acetyltransferase [Verrucomicrobia bacterium]|nr:GNAT family N-acetyltransferase [Verrucomicrobiota bacterium]
MTPIQPYQGSIRVQPISKSGPLEAHIETDHLLISSWTEGDLEDCVRLYGDAGAMSKVLNGQTFSRKTVEERLQTSVQRCLNRDPFHRMTVRLKETNQFLGTISAVHSDNPGVCEISGVGLPEFHNRGYGKEASAAVLHGYLPLVKDFNSIGGKPLEKVVGTSRIDNNEANRVMQDAGMNCVRVEPRYEGLRHVYEISVENLGLESLRSKTEVLGPNSIGKMALLGAKIKLFFLVLLQTFKQTWKEMDQQAKNLLACIRLRQITPRT